MGAGMMIAKAILGGIGGGFSGAADGMNTAEVGSTNTDHKDKYKKLGYDIGNQGFDKLAQQKESLMNQFLSFHPAMVLSHFADSAESLLTSLLFRTSSSVKP